MRLILENQPGPKEAACRRSFKRRKINPMCGVCWTQRNQRCSVTIIEADTQGARLVLPFPLEKGDEIFVSFSNRLGLHRTERSTIAWSKQLDSSGKTVVGLYYQSKRAEAA